MQNEDTSLNDRFFIHHHEYENINSGIRFHNGYEFLYVKRGGVALFANDKKFYVESGKGALLLPNTVHSYKSASPSKCYICIFSEKFIPDFNRIKKIGEPDIFIFNVTYGGEITHLLKNAKDRFMQKGMLYTIISMAAGSFEKTRQEGKSIDIADKILGYIEKNYLCDITLKDVADDLNYQYNYLSKLVNRIFKTSFSKLLNKYRIYTAQQLLRNTNQAITIIANNCGYSSVRSFNRNFRKITGQTPTEYIDDIRKY